MKNEFDAYTRVRELASERNMTISCLARTCGLNPSTIYVTKKRNGQMTLDTIMRICDGLGMQLGEFFTPPNSTDNIGGEVPGCLDLRKPGSTLKDLRSCMCAIEPTRVTGYERLPTGLFGEEKLGVGIACGNGMSDFSVRNGDEIFVTLDREPKPGDVVLVSVDGSEWMLRQLLIDESTGAYRLHASGTEPREDLLCNEMKIYGVLSHVVRDLRA